VAEERWTLDLVAAGPGAPLVVRVKRLLKSALRTHGLRCVGTKSTPATPDLSNGNQRIQIADGDGVVTKEPRKQTGYSEKQ
jgi:hypothetical protein